MKTHALLVIAVLLLASSCDRYKCNGNGTDQHYTVYINSELKNYFFKPGSYWVYETSALPYTDSVFVTAYDHSFHYTNNSVDLDCGFTAEENYVMKYDQILGASVLNNLTWTFTDNSIHQKMMVYYVQLASGPGAAGVWRIAVDTNIIVAGIDYTSAKVFRYDSLVLAQPGQIVIDEFEYTTDYYWCPRVGIIKKVEYGTPQGTREWHLVRKNIIL